MQWLNSFAPPAAEGHPWSLLLNVPGTCFTNKFKHCHPSLCYTPISLKSVTAIAQCIYYGHYKVWIMAAELFAARKVIFLAIQDASKEWTMPIRNWKAAPSIFMI
ncbi:hypothetical protein [Zooshikella ganghwensis]|uniref:hypothetical protein n=1 Tax=Zooshikella ganghwensis TaxID=202772 RepID=UPI0012F75F13|nr:hypothetical protein [Zooshikella ganghwensis]